MSDTNKHQNLWDVTGYDQLIGCSYLWRASHPHHGHDGRAETQGLLQTAIQQAEIFQLGTNTGQRENSDNTKD